MKALNLIRLAALSWLVLALPARAAELIMVERQGCHYCIEWKTDLGPIYPKTAEGVYAPLRIVDIKNAPPADVEFDRRVIYTPTFILVEDGRELARLEGYPGQDFFWGLLEKMLVQNTDFEKPVQMN